MKYTIQSHQTTYSGTNFRSRLEARWAAFFDLIEWKWQYEPLDVLGWTPNFFVEFPCGHSECPPIHTLLVEIKPYWSLDEFRGHPCLSYGFRGWGNDKFPADSSAAFGINPHVTWWEFSHGAGGGVESLDGWLSNTDLDTHWKVAGNVVQWKPGNSR